MVEYARDDTHYLLYIYDRMRNELVRRGGDDNQLLHSVLKQSQGVCLRLYAKPLFDEEDYLKLFQKHKRRFNSQQVCCFDQHSLCTSTLPLALVLFTPPP